jgi:O-acetyl-ADP-ribose deacetylase (regulator of RNase III)
LELRFAIVECSGHRTERRRHEIFGLACNPESKNMIHEVTEKGDVKSLAMPRLATGFGSMEWSVVHPLVVQHLGDLTIPVYVYTTYAKGQQADEPAE